MLGVAPRANPMEKPKQPRQLTKAERDKAVEEAAKKAQFQPKAAKGARNTPAKRALKT